MTRPALFAIDLVAVTTATVERTDLVNHVGAQRPAKVGLRG